MKQNVFTGKTKIDMFSSIVEKKIGILLQSKDIYDFHKQNLIETTCYFANLKDLKQAKTGRNCSPSTYLDECGILIAEYIESKYNLIKTYEPQKLTENLNLIKPVFIKKIYIVDTLGKTSIVGDLVSLALGIYAAQINNEEDKLINATIGFNLTRALFKQLVCCN